MSNVEEINMLPTEVTHVECDTELSVKRVVFDWVVGNFSLHSRYAKQTIQSPEFNIGNVPYYLCLDTSQTNESDEVPIAICLSRVNQDEPDQNINYKISILDGKNNPLITQEEEGQLLGKKPAGRRMLFCIFGNDKESVLQYDELHIRCEATCLLQSHYYMGESWLDRFRGSFDGSLISLLSRRNRRDETRRRKLRTRYVSKTQFCILIIIFSAYFLALNALMGTNNRCTKWIKDIDELVINSTHQMINIAEALNLTEMKVKASEFLYSYADQHNVPITDVPTFT